jgi:hypothetical protein
LGEYRLAMSVIVVGMLPANSHFHDDRVTICFSGRYTDGTILRIGCLRVANCFGCD